MKFTPGPWIHQAGLVLTADLQKGIAKVFPRADPMGGRVEETATAALIAASPDMFRALEKVFPLLSAYSEGPWAEASSAVESALKKAKGL